MPTAKRSLPLLVLLGSSFSAIAHPSIFHATNFTNSAHSSDLIGATQAGFLHPFFGLDHLLVMVAVGLWAAQMGGRALWLLPSAFAGSMLLGGFVGLLGIQRAFVEHGILASLIMLGIALGITWRPSLLIASLCVGAAGLCHGYAHGSEMPSGIIPALFLAGMISATALLHALGITAGLSLRQRSLSIVFRTAGCLLLAFALTQAIRIS